MFEQNIVMILFKISKFWFQWNSLGCFKALSNILLHPTHIPQCIFFLFFFFFFFVFFFLLLNFASMKKLVISFYSLIFATLKPSKPAKYTPPMFFFSGAEFPTIANLIFKKEYFVARFLYFGKKKSSNKKVQFWVRFATFLILAIIGSKTIKGNCFLDRSR